MGSSVTSEKPDKKGGSPKKNQEELSAGERVEGIVEFLKGVVVEFKKISWPDRQQVIKETYSVIVLVAVITSAVLAFDFAVGKVIFEPLDHLARTLGGGVGR